MKRKFFVVIVSILHAVQLLAVGVRTNMSDSAIVRHSVEMLAYQTLDEAHRRRQLPQ